MGRWGLHLGDGPGPIQPLQVFAAPQMIKFIDCRTCTVEEVQNFQVRPPPGEGGGGTPAYGLPWGACQV